MALYATAIGLSTNEQHGFLRIIRFPRRVKCSFSQYNGQSVVVDTITGINYWGDDFVYAKRDGKGKT